MAKNQSFKDGKKKHKNRLLSDKSFYLCQHTHQPLVWYPWKKEAFDRTKKENTPILKSLREDIFSNLE